MSALGNFRKTMRTIFVGGALWTVLGAAQYGSAGVEPNPENADSVETEHQERQGKTNMALGLLTMFASVASYVTLRNKVANLDSIQSSSQPKNQM